MSSTTFCNPILDLNMPDPHIFVHPDKKQVSVISTCSLGKKGKDRHNVQRATTKDFHTWTVQADALPELPDWAKRSSHLPEWNQIFAPAVAIHPETNQLLLYFSAVIDNGPGKLFSGIGVAQYSEDAGYFIPENEPLVYEESFTAIDPMVFIHPKTGEPTFLWGSGDKGIRARRLKANLTEFSDDKVRVLIDANKHYPYETLLEGADVQFVEDSEFPIQIHISGDDVWKKGRYVVLSYLGKSLDKPLIPISKVVSGRNDNVILSHGSDDTQYHGRPGHSTTFKDAHNQLWIAYHAVKESEPYLRDVSNLEDIVPQERVHRAVMIQKLSMLDGILIPEGGTLTEAATPICTPQSYPTL